VNLSTRAWNDLIKPAGQAALLGGVAFGLGWTISGAPEGGAMWGLSGAALVLARKFLLDEALEARKPPAPEKTRKPWEASVKVTVAHTDKYGYGPVWWYEIPIPKKKLYRAGFHLNYMGGRFSSNYFTNWRHDPKIFSKGEFEKLEKYLLENHAAKWKGMDKREGVELLEDAREMLSYFGSLYYPLPHEKKTLARFARTGDRTYHT
jgi:hypothetical protein